MNIDQLRGTAVSPMGLAGGLAAVFLIMLVVFKISKALVKAALLLGALAALGAAIWLFILNPGRSLP